MTYDASVYMYMRVAGEEVKPCPRCSAFIVKMDDGSCNHMTCAVCGAEFCWLCMKEISDLHYLRSVDHDMLRQVSPVDIFVTKMNILQQTRYTSAVCNVEIWVSRYVVPDRLPLCYTSLSVLRAARSGARNRGVARRRSCGSWARWLEHLSASRCSLVSPYLP